MSRMRTQGTAMLFPEVRSFGGGGCLQGDDDSVFGRVFSHYIQGLIRTFCVPSTFVRHLGA